MNVEAVVRGWLDDGDVTYTAGFDWSGGYTFDVEMNDLELGFFTPSEWEFKDPFFGVTILDLSDLWTGFTMGPRFTLGSTLAGTVYTDNLAYEVDVTVLGQPIFSHLLPLGTSNSNLSLGWLSGSYSAYVDFDFNDDLTWGDIEGTVDLGLEASSTIPLGEARLPLLGIPFLLDLVIGGSAGVSIGVDASVTASVTPQGGYGWESASISPSVEARAGVYGEAQAIGGLVGEAGASVTAVVSQAIVADWAPGSGWSYSAPGSLDLVGTAYWSALGGLFGDEYELFDWVIADWDFLTSSGSPTISHDEQGDYSGSLARGVDVTSGDAGAAAVYAGNPEIYVQLKGAGEQWGGVEKLTNNDHLEQALSVAYDSSGQPFVTWMEGDTLLSNQDTYTLQQRAAGQQIRVARYDGANWHQTAITSDAMLNASPSLAFAAAGVGGTVAWERATATDEWIDPDSLEIAYSNWNGSAWSSPGALTTNSYPDWGADVAYLADGHPIVTWLFDSDGDYVGSHTPGPTTGVAYARWTGSAWERGTLASDGSTFNQWAQAVSLVDGTTEVYWVSLDDSGYSLKMKAFDGTSWLSTQTILADQPMIWAPAVTSDSSGAVSVVYNGSDGTQNDLYVISHASPWTEPKKLTDDALVQHGVAVAGDGDRGLFVRTIEDDYFETGESGSSRYTDPDAGTFEGTTGLMVRGLVGAGNVVAKVVKGNLKITGDALDNHITITQGLTSNEFVITGTGTTVNGGAQVTLGGVTKSFRINLRGGDDLMKLDGLIVPDKLIVRTGWGDDRVELENVNVLGRTNINTGRGNDDVLIDPTEFGRNARVKTGGGADLVTLAEVTFKRRGRILTGWGADTVSVADSDFQGKADLKTGSGDDAVKLENTSTFAARCDVKTSGGADHVWITESDFDKKLKLILGGGTDWLTEQDCVLTGGAMANGGWGKDTYEYIGLGTSGVNRKSFEVFV